MYKNENYDEADELIEKYAQELERVYSEQTAGDYTFHGILAKLLNEYDKVTTDHIQPNP